MRKAYTIFLLLFLSTIASAQQSQRLTAGWQFLQSDVGGIWEVIRPVSSTGPEAMPLWKAVTLPHCVNAEDAVDPDVNYYQGPAWYRTILSVDNPYPNGRTLLHFEGAGQKTEVYIYDQKVGSHVGGYDEFWMDITDAIAAFRNTPAYEKAKGKISVAVRTDNSRDLEMIPSNLSDFSLYGGLYRYVNLVYRPAVSVQKIAVKSTLINSDKTGRLELSAQWYNPTRSSITSASLRLLSPTGKEVLRTRIANPTDTTAHTTLTFNQPRLWSTGTPLLYTLEVSVEAEGQTSTYSEKIGFRTAEFRPKGPFFLNGKRSLLRGTHRHEDAAGVGAALTEEMMRQEMLLMKEMGVNFIRLGHYQQSRIILNLCDSLGILVWEEIPWCRGGVGGEMYKEQGRRMLTNMMEQHYNHPSVVLWGLGNENDWPGDAPVYDSAAVRNYMQELNTIAHSRDSNRLTAIRRCEFCRDIPDVYSPTIWAGWYRGIYTDYKAFSQGAFNQNQRFLHAEWGADSHTGRHAELADSLLLAAMQQVNKTDTVWAAAARLSKTGDWNETYACNLMDWHLKEQETMPWLTGSAQWAFRDFSTPIRPDNPVPYVNQKGLVERDLTPKEAYYVFQSYWATKPMVHIYGHSWPVRWGAAGEQKLLKVYSNCTEAELFLNGESLGVKKRNTADYPAAGLHWQASFTPGRNSLKVIASDGNAVVTDSLSFDYETRRWSKPAKVVLKKMSEKNGIATVQAHLVDGNEVPCLDAKDWVRFSLAGNGKMIDNQGTASGSRSVQASNGRAAMNVLTEKGQSVLSVQVKGLPVAFIQL